MSYYYALTSQNAMMQQMLNYDTEIGSHAKTPNLNYLCDFSKWDLRFKAHLRAAHPECIQSLEHTYIKCLLILVVMVKWEK